MFWSNSIQISLNPAARCEMPIFRTAIHIAPTDATGAAQKFGIFKEFNDKPLKRRTQYQHSMPCVKPGKQLKNIHFSFQQRK